MSLGLDLDRNFLFVLGKDHIFHPTLTFHLETKHIIPMEVHLGMIYLDKGKCYVKNKQYICLSNLFPLEVDAKLRE